METDGLSWNGPTEPFEASAWRDKRDRPALARHVDDSRLLGRKTKAEVEALLGPPDEQWRLGRGTWEIRIPCGSGGMNWDSFFYWPGHAYPGSGFGGGVERIGAWAYVHE